MQANPARQLFLPMISVFHPLKTPQSHTRVGVYLSRALGTVTHVTLTHNRRTMLSVRRVEGVRRVRLHSMFADAPTRILDAVSRYIAHGDRHAATHIDAFVRENQHCFARVDLTSNVKKQSVVHDLDGIVREICERYFPGSDAVRVVWGQQRCSRRQGITRSIRLGVYEYDRRLIRVHPCLDCEWVPRYFVAWVVFHELLHHVMPVRTQGNRRRLHSPEFRAIERSFHDYERAIDWERINVRRLIAARDEKTFVPG
jgi:hypothetical protein